MDRDCTRRQLLAMSALLSLTALRVGHPASGHAASSGTFEVDHEGRRVRCLFHASVPTTVPPLAVVLLHGANTDASQWLDIGLDAAVDDVAAGHPTPLVAVAADTARSPNVTALIFDAVLPAIDIRFAPHGAAAISGISRGARQALDAALASPRRFSSIGLHSPALAGAVDPAAIKVPVFIDAGESDPLLPSARRFASELRRTGVPVTAHWSPGGHNRPYWRSQLREYLDFHLQIHETTT